MQPLREAEPPIVPRERLGAFIAEVFHNFAELHVHHRRLLDRMHAVQRDEHPVVHSVTAAIFDAALNWREAYMEYVTHYPIAEYRIVDEMNTNPLFKAFVEVRRARSVLPSVRLCAVLTRRRARSNARATPTRTGWTSSRSSTGRSRAWRATSCCSRASWRRAPTSTRTGAASRR